MSLMGVLGHFAQTVLTTVGSEIPDCVSAISAFLALSQVCELVAASVRYDVRPEELLGKVHYFLELFVAAFGYEWLTPKLHWMLHYAESLLKNKRLFNCFCLERKHKVPKRYAEDHKKVVRSSSQSILSEVICNHYAKCNVPGSLDFTVGLIDGRPCPRRSRKLILQVLGVDDEQDDIQVAIHSRINEYEICSKGDVVLLNDGGDVRAARIAQHLNVAGVPLSMVHPWTLVRRVANTRMSIWRTTADAEIWVTADILLALEHTVFTDGTVGILMPKHRA